ncbi:MAG: electron transfer flavoprotein subunit beta/FixA family protein [Candidatus Methanoplasma sp.]|jgi:electron transfer flavoprotein beta subunit|nr:electron transfer flavoprotein subunit beta/FixA family protein [Candidatus Methanoplasma sp.]
MRFVVFVKQVPDTSSVGTDENGNLMREGVPSILNPYCEFALDMACRVKGEGDIISVVTMGPPQAESALFRCLELGADEAFLLTDRAFAGADVYATAKTLSAFLKKFIPDHDLLFCGRQAMDGDTAQVPAELASMMGCGQFYYTEDLVFSDGWKAVQNYYDEERECALKKGDLISVSKGETDPRLPSVADYIRASGTEIKKLDRVDIGLGTFSVGLKGSKTRITSSRPVSISRRGILTDGGDPTEAAKHIKGMVR